MKLSLSACNNFDYILSKALVALQKEYKKSINRTKLLRDIISVDVIYILVTLFLL